MPEAGKDENQVGCKRPLPTPARAAAVAKVAVQDSEDEAEASADPAQKTLKPRKPPTRQDLPLSSFVFVGEPSDTYLRYVRRNASSLQPDRESTA